MARRPPPLLQDLRRLFRGVSLVALEAAKRSPNLEAARAGDLEALVSQTLKAVLVSATDLAGLTRGTPRQMSASHSTRQSSIVYFSNDYEPEVTAFRGGSADPSILEKPSPQSQTKSRSRLVDVQEVPIAASAMMTAENNCRSQELEDGATMEPGVLRENGSMKDPILSSLPEMNLVGSAGGDVPLKRRRPRERRVPSTPISRALGFAGLGAGLAWGTIQESAKRIVFGMPKIEGKQSALSPFLSEKNAERLALALCRMRGAALKFGQMLSIQDESLVPAPILAALDIVRQGADVMPRKQLNDVLDAELSLDWSSKLRSFDYEPLAAASIGQVHRAVMKSGLKVAMKIQYPGVADSIESDIENVRLILDYTNLIPKGLFLDNAIKVAKEELSRECDYELEAASQKRFRDFLSDSEGFYVPMVIDEISSKKVLTTELITGVAIDKVALLSQKIRDYVGKKFLELTLKELFVFRFMQVMPPLWCRFERMWFGHPGILEGTLTKQPFVCPMDHLFEIHTMLHGLSEEEFGPQIHFREYSFLQNPSVPKHVKESLLNVQLCDAHSKGCNISDGTTSRGFIQFPRNSTEQMYMQVFSQYKDIKVLHFSSMANAFQGFNDEAREVKFRNRMKRYVGMWCCVENRDPGHIYYDIYWDEKPEWKPEPPRTSQDDHPPWD